MTDEQVVRALPADDLYRADGFDRAGWPVAGIDSVQRLHALAAGIPGAVVSERVIDAPLERVWAHLGDLERSVPQSEWHVRTLSITWVDGDRLEADVRSVVGIHDRFTVVLRPGWCWMQGRVLYAGMAAVAVSEGTRVAWAVGLRLPGSALWRPFLRRGIAHSLRRLDRQLQARSKGARASGVGRWSRHG